MAKNTPSRNNKKIALTFDDGPNPFWTIKIIDLLDEYNIRGTFFVLGKWVKKYPHIAEEIINRGHLVGNHGYSHSRNFGDFSKAEKIINKILGVSTKFIRAPYLEVKNCKNYQKNIIGKKIKIVNGDILYDWNATCAEEILKLAEKKIKNRAIFILHDGSKRPGELKSRPKMMFEALPMIIKMIKSKGFKIVQLDNLI